RRLDYRRPAALRVAGVRWVYRLADGRPSWDAVPDPLPRARLVARAVPSAWPLLDLDRIDVATTALVDYPPLPHQGPPGGAELVSDRPGGLPVSAVADGRQLLVLTERAHRGWTAQLDGRETRVLRVNGDFLGCYVPPGAHRVRFQYRPAALA